MGQRRCSRWAGQVIGWASLSGARVRRGSGVSKTCRVWVKFLLIYRHLLGACKLFFRRGVL